MATPDQSPTEDNPIIVPDDLLAEGSSAEQVQATFEHNAKQLNEASKTLRGDTVHEFVDENGKKVYGRFLNLYVDTASGRIFKIASEEKERNAERRKRGIEVHEDELATNYLRKVVAPGLPEMPTDDVVRVTGCMFNAVPDVKTFRTEGAVTTVVVDRPDDWVRNDLIDLIADEGKPSPSELLPDSFARGILEKSLDDYNNAPQPAEVRVD